MPAHLILDIETIPDPELPRQDEGERVPPPPFNQIVTLGCLLLEDYVPRRMGVVGEHKTEGAILTDFAHWLDARRPTVVTWNGRGRPSGRRATASPSRTAPRTSSASAASTISGTRVVMSSRVRVKTATPEPSR